MSNRYLRQIAVPGIGATGQERLTRSKVLVVGAGGLGSMVLQSLGAGGIGHLVILDPDRVEESNLHRQPLYRETDIGRLKALAAREALLAMNAGLQVDARCEAVHPGNTPALVAAADIVVDAADSFAATYTLSDECHRRGKLLISASVLGLRGYVGAFCDAAPSYRAVFPEIPTQAGTCAQSGVLGTAVAVIGALQAQMTMSAMLQLTPTLPGTMLSLDLRDLRISSFRFDDANEPEAAKILRFVSSTDTNDATAVIDLRSAREISARPFQSSLRSSVEEIAQTTATLPRGGRVLLCCRSGLRAWRAARTLQDQGFEHLALIALG
jgi:sulfur-carrier protein adenylyltransferase/sulfurtransferase